MAKYTIIKDITLTTIRPVGSNIPQNQVSFKNGDIVDGELGGNSANDTGYLQVTTPKGIVHFSTSRGSVITAYLQTDSAAKDTTIKNGSGLEKTQTKAINFFTTKNIIIGVLAIGAIFGILKFTKKI
jgi:hypothetical protein